MTVKRETKSGPSGEVIKALRSMTDKFQYRTAKGLAKQSGLPLEHVEHYIITLAQKGKVSVLIGPEGQFLAQIAQKPEEGQ